MATLCNLPEGRRRAVAVTWHAQRQQMASVHTADPAVRLEMPEVFAWQDEPQWSGTALSMQPAPLHGMKIPGIWADWLAAIVVQGSTVKVRAGIDCW